MSPEQNGLELIFYTAMPSEGEEALPPRGG